MATYFQVRSKLELFFGMVPFGVRDWGDSLNFKATIWEGALMSYVNHFPFKRVHLGGHFEDVTWTIGCRLPFQVVQPGLESETEAPDRM